MRSFACAAEESNLMSNTISASSAIALSKTDDAPEPSPLEAMIERARLASERMSAQNPNRHLLREMATTIVAMARMNADLMQQQQASERRIILPGN